MFNETLEISLALFLFLIEMIIALLVVIAVLFILNRAKKILVENLLKKLKQLESPAEEDADTPLEPPEQPEAIEDLADTEPTYQEWIDIALDNTKEYHALCFETKKITLDDSTSIDEQIIALRYIFLLSEKSLARYDEKTPDFWAQLKNRLKKIIHAYEVEEEEEEEDSADNQGDVERLENELASLKQRISNLETFKKLFFDLQSKCSEIHQQGEAIHEQAQALVSSSDNPDGLNDLLDRYQQNFEALGSAMSAAAPTQQTIVTHKDSPGVNQVLQVNTNLEEIDKLKSVADDQHRIITQLRSELGTLSQSSEEEIEEKVHKIEEHMQQIEKSLAESEMCVQMLESDYHEAMEQVHALEQQLADLSTEHSSLQSSFADTQGAQTLVDKLTQESKEVMACMTTLEDDNEQLSLQVKKLKLRLKAKNKIKPKSSGVDEGKLQAKLTEKEAEVLRLQTEYSQLEGQYLDVFQKLNSK